MKRVCSILMVITIMIGLCGCGKSQAVKDVETAIQEIGEVNSESGRSITAAENLNYDLDEKEKSKVENYDTLQYSRKLYDALQRRDYYSAICLYAENKNVEGIKNVLQHLDYGDEAIKIAVVENNMIVTVVMGADYIVAKEGEKPCWLHFYSFPTGGGIPQRFGIGADYNTLDFERTVETIKMGDVQLGGKVLYSFDLS